jgi:hypothetical protein
MSSSSSSYVENIHGDVTRMRQLFHENTRTTSTEEKYQKWELLWKEKCTPWDLGEPTKVLISELETEMKKHREQRRQWEYSTALIPGCGSGYDVVSLGRYWDAESSSSAVASQRIVVGLEISETSLDRAINILKQSIQVDGPFQRTTVQLYLGDFFADPSSWTLYYEQPGTMVSEHDDDDDYHHHNTVLWTSNYTCPSVKSFDFIFDYTFFCAIPPLQRPEWGRQMTLLLSPEVNTSAGTNSKQESTSNQEGKNRKSNSGKLLTLMFPYVPTPRPNSPGPPYLVSTQDYLDAFVLSQDDATIDMDIDAAQHSCSMTLELQEQPYENKHTVPSRKGQEFVAWWSVRQVEKQHSSNLVMK